MSRSHSQQRFTEFTFIIPLLLGMALILFALQQNSYLGLWLLGMSVVSLFSYYVDKRAAASQRWRIPEARLHVQDLLGGWVGGLLARQLWRHKTSKKPFVWVFWLTALLNIAAVMALIFSLKNGASLY